MKTVAILLINFYQSFISVSLKNILGTQAFCRFDVTCSQYAKTSIQNYGLTHGLVLSIRRIIICQPFYKNEQHI